jgi:uncharacterized SAM-binding protein YcdF (DUF218 family)
LSRASEAFMMGAPRPRGLARAVLVAVLFIAVLAGLSLWALLRVGSWLVVEDPLARAAAIVVMGGHVPFRAMEAAALYNASWAPEVWLTRAASGPEEAALARLGLNTEIGDTAVNRVVLKRLGVPPDAVRVLTPGARNTVEEVHVIADTVTRGGADRVIIVTSKPHSRRVRAIWHAVVGSSPQAVVRYAESDAFDPEHWWRRTSDALAVSREVLGLMNVWTGFPVRPDTTPAGAQTSPEPQKH